MAAAIFTLAGCDTGINPGGGDSVAFSVSGSFTKTGGAAGSGEVKFDLKRDAAGHTLSGVLEDGDLTIRLKGSYDPNTGRWSVSARSSNIMYTLDGIVDRAGKLQTANATIMVKSGAGVNETWSPYFFPVTEGAVSIPNAGTAVDGETGGVPAVWQGNWYSYKNYGGGYTASINVLISDWNASVSGISKSPYGSKPIAENYTLIELTGSGNGPYEYIGCYPDYVMTSERFAAAVRSHLGPSVTVTADTGPGVGIIINEAGSSSSWSADVSVDVGSGTIIWEIPMPIGRIGPPEEVTPPDIEVPEGDRLDADAAWEKLDEFWSTGGWEQWAANNGVEQANRYVKARITFTGSNSNSFNMINMVAVENPSKPWEYTYIFPTLAALKVAEATLVEEHDWDESTWPPTNKGVEVMTFTR
ncbi:MAG: hypothetical protein LBQ67_04105 [Treponema sp.]|nr:hypothetical protein [Treponema sp.]